VVAIALVAGLAPVRFPDRGSAGIAPAVAQAPPAVPTRPGRPAPAAVVAELQAALAHGIARFEARDLEGVLALISDEYRTGPLTKLTVRAQLLAMFQVYQQLRAQVRIDEVRLVGEHAWVYSTGEVSGQLPVVGQWMTLFGWERELEVARREGGRWRLFGYQQ
jgi:hypothetical protein